MLICCSGMIDIMTLVGFYRFARYGTTFRPVMTIFLFYGLRTVIQSIFFMEKPEGYDWDYPGFPSIFVPYGKTADFFYSGHVGICMINYLEFSAVGWRLWALFAIFVSGCQVFLMITLRSHYSIDLLAGFLFAHYMFLICEKYSYIIDWWIFRIPLSKRLAPCEMSVNFISCKFC